MPLEIRQSTPMVRAELSRAGCLGPYSQVWGISKDGDFTLSRELFHQPHRKKTQVFFLCLGLWFSRILSISVCGHCLLSFVWSPLRRIWLLSLLPPSGFYTCWWDPPEFCPFQAEQSQLSGLPPSSGAPDPVLVLWPFAALLPVYPCVSCPGSPELGTAFQGVSPVLSKGLVILLMVMGCPGIHSQFGNQSSGSGFCSRFFPWQIQDGKAFWNPSSFRIDLFQYVVVQYVLHAFATWLWLLHASWGSIFLCAGIILVKTSWLGENYYPHLY